MTIVARLEQIHANIQIKLAQQGMPPDRETLAEANPAMTSVTPVCTEADLTRDVIPLPRIMFALPE